MKFLKWLLIVLMGLSALVLIIPAFLPGEVTVDVETEIAVAPELVFRNAAQFTDRDQWDPWLEMEPDARVTIDPEPGFVGSTYAWEGEKIGSGRMRVDSVNYPDFIASDIWFGPSPEPSRVQWILEETAQGTHITWQFISEGSYPFGRIMLQFMKGPLKTSFESGLANYKAYLEENPPRMFELSKIGKEKSYATDAIVIPAEGTMEEMEEKIMTLFPKLAEQVKEQELGLNGPPFIHVLAYEDENEMIEALLALPVKKKGKKSGDIYPKYYEPVEAIAITLYGSYNYLPKAYEALNKYIADKQFEVKNESFEVLLKSKQESLNPMEIETMIAIPLK